LKLIERYFIPDTEAAIGAIQAPMAVRGESLY